MDAIRQLADRRKEELLPLNIVVVVNFNDVEPARSALKGKGVTTDPLTGVVLAGTPYSGSAVYSLGGVLDPHGKWQSNYTAASKLVNVGSDYFGKGIVQIDGVTDKNLKQALGYLNQGFYEVAPKISKLTKKKGEVGEQATAAMAQLKAHLTERYEAVSKLALTNFSDYQKAEALLADMKTAKIRELRDQEKALATEVKNNGKVANIKLDLKARKFYQNLLVQSCSANSNKRTEAYAGFRQLVAQLPDSHYAQLAQRRIDIASSAAR